jgi:hypothetical protein
MVLDNTAVIVQRMSWATVLLPDAEEELDGLSRGEGIAMLNAIEKLKALGPNLPYPHSSHVKIARSLRELRPRGGRSPHRGFYRRVGDVFVVAAIGPEAEADHLGFERAVGAAEERLKDLEEE